MGTSERSQIPSVLDVVVAEKPRTILDVGAGYGKYGFLVREYAQLERVDGLDIGPPRYPSYDHFYIGDVRELDRVLPMDVPRYDLALFIEVLEHLERPEGMQVLQGLTRRAKRVLVSTPWGFRHQDIEGLPYETHRSGWYPWDFLHHFRVHQLRVYPGNWSRYLRFPRLWQIMVLISAKEAP